MRKNIIIVVLAALSLCACDIDRLPTTSMAGEEIQNDPADKLEALVNGMYAQLKVWSDPMHRLGEYAGDNIMIRGSSTDAFYEFISYSRTPNNYRLQNFWDYGYKAIAQASNIIKMIPESSDAEVNNKLGECYFVRGMMYFYLVRAFGRPYYQAPDKNLGVPIVNGTPDNITSDLHLADRATVEQTYEQAISDLKKAETLLTVKEYAQLAVDYATKVINSGDYSLLPRDEFMKYNTYSPDDNKESIFVIRRVASEFSGYDHYYGIGGMYSNIGGMGWGEMYASAKYIDLLNETGRNDWRPEHKVIVDARANFIEPQYYDPKQEVFRFIKYDNATTLNYAQLPVTRNEDKVTCSETDKDNNTTTYELTPIDAKQEIYSINYKGKTYQGVLDDYINLNRVYPEFYIVKCSREGEESQLHSPVISRLGEIYLNRAEAYAKLGKYDEALKDLNLIRERSIPGAGYTSLDASNAPERIDKERQLELAYQAERSYDVFRNGGTLTRHYPGPHKQFEDIKATDYRVTYYIPQDAINSYPGTLTQNPTSDAGVVLH